MYDFRLKNIKANKNKNPVNKKRLGFLIMIKVKEEVVELIDKQENYEQLKKQSELTEKFIRLTDNLKFDDKDIPKTEKGLTTKAKELLEKVQKKIEKEI